MKFRNTLLLLTLFCQVFIGYSQEKASKEPKFTTDWEVLKKHKPSAKWMKDGKFGISFHWGVYSVPATDGEWYPRWMYVPDRVGWGSEIYKKHRANYGEDFDYHDFIPMWKAPKFDASEWVSLFEKAGAKFVGTIAEHHDGFSLWDSKVNEWNSAQMGPKIDVVKAIYEETKKRDLKFMATFHHGFNPVFYPKPESEILRPVCLYDIVQSECTVPQDKKYAKLYGNLDWDESNDLWLGKLDEVIDSYLPDYIWMDFGQRYIKESHRKQFLANYFNRAEEQGKDVIVNTKGTFFPDELAIVNVERATMLKIQKETWITDFILGSSWCYNKEKRTAIDPGKAIRILADVVSKNGVMMLSAGPMADGSIPEEQIDALKHIGDWLNTYGESIYKTRPFVAFGEGTTILKVDKKDEFKNYGAIKKGFEKFNATDVRYTQNGKNVYAIQLGWNSDKGDRLLTTFSKEAKHLKIKKVSVLGSDEKINWKKTKTGLQVSQPEVKPNQAELAMVYKIEVY